LISRSAPRRLASVVVTLSRLTRLAYLQTSLIAPPLSSRFHHAPRRFAPRYSPAQSPTQPSSTTSSHPPACTRRISLFPFDISHKELTSRR
jgi:hypothetical protein